MLRQHWDRIHRPKYRVLDWSMQQQKVLNRIREGTSIDDKEAKKKSMRWSYVSGAPGSGKSALILEGAVAAAKVGLHVLIVCPTGQLVHSFKAQLPDVDGIENISIDTIHGVLNYQRPGKDRQVRWAPPSALRRYDLILVDEAGRMMTGSGSVFSSACASSLIYRIASSLRIFSSCSQSDLEVIAACCASS